MSTTKLRLYNLALRRLGVESVTSDEITNGSNKRAKVLNDIYADVLEEALASHPWPFAVKTITVTLTTAKLYYECLVAHTSADFNDDLTSAYWSVIAEDTSLSNWATETSYTVGDQVLAPHFGYAYKRTLPSDYLRMLKEDDSYEYERRDSTIYSDTQTLNLEYIASITDESKFDPSFAKYFYLQLAMEASYSLKQDKELYDRLKKEAEEVKAEARCYVSQESSPDDFDFDGFVDARL